MTHASISPREQASILVKLLYKRVDDQASRFSTGIQEIAPSWLPDTEMQAVLNSTSQQAFELAYASIKSSAGFKKQAQWCYQYLFKASQDFIHPDGSRLSLLAHSSGFIENTEEASTFSHSGSFSLTEAELRKMQARLKSLNEESHRIQYLAIPLVLGPDASDVSPLKIRTWMLKAYSTYQTTKPEALANLLASAFCSEEETQYAANQSLVLNYALLILRIEKPTVDGAYDTLINVNSWPDWDSLTELITPMIFERSVKFLASGATPSNSKRKVRVKGMARIYYPIDMALASFYRMASYATVGMIWNISDPDISPELLLEKINDNYFVKLQSKTQIRPTLLPVPRLLPLNINALFEILQATSQSLLSFVSTAQRDQPES